MWFFKSTEYPESYANDYQTYYVAKAQINQFALTSARDQKYKITLQNIGCKYLEIYPVPNLRPQSTLSRDHQKKIKEEIMLIQTINAMEAIHQKTLVLCNSAELFDNNLFRANFINVSLMDTNVIAYSLKAEDGCNIFQEDSGIKLSDFRATTILQYKQAILAHAQTKGYIRAPDNTPRTDYTEDEVKALKNHIETLKGVHSRLNSYSISYLYFGVYAFTAIGALASLILAVLSIASLFFIFPLVPWDPLLSITFLIPLVTCAYLCIQALHRTTLISVSEAPLKEQLGFYIKDNEDILLKNEVTFNPNSNGSNSSL